MLRRTASKRRVDVPRITTHRAIRWSCFSSRSVLASGGAVSAANRSWHPVELFQPPIGLASNAPLPLPLPEHSADVSESLPLGAASSPPHPPPPPKPPRSAPMLICDFVQAACSTSRRKVVLSIKPEDYTTLPLFSLSSLPRRGRRGCGCDAGASGSPATGSVG